MAWRGIAAFTLAILCAATASPGQEPDPRIGTRVVTRFGTVLRVGERVVDDEGRAANRARSGVDFRSSRTYRVRRINGDWLWLQDEGSGAVGWVRSRFVMTFDEALALYTEQIREQPRAFLYNSRGSVWGAKGEYDIAIADYNEAIRLEPENADSLYNRATVRESKKDYDRAIADYEEVIRRNPGLALAYRGRGRAWAGKKDFDRAIANYDEAIRLDPQLALAYQSRGYARWSKEQYDEAVADYDEAIRLDPQFALAYQNRGCVRRDKKDFDGAIADYDGAIRLDPNNPITPHMRGAAWIGKEEYDKAIADYDEAIRLDPRSPLAFGDRANARLHKKDFDGAIADYGEAVRLDPSFALALNNRAWLWATCPVERFRDGKKAVESATRACELGEWKVAYQLGTLAAAQAEAGAFDRAIEWQSKANDLYADAEDKRKGEERLKLYADRKPYRQEPEP